MTFSLTLLQKRSVLLAVTIIVSVLLHVLFNIPTSSKLVLCLLLGAGHGPAALSHQGSEERIVYSHIEHSLHHILSQPAMPPSKSQDSSLIPPAHLSDPKVLGNFDPRPSRANATLVILARNSDLRGVIQSIEQLESKFNRKFNYPWVLLNEQEFSAEFKR